MFGSKKKSNETGVGANMSTPANSHALNSLVQGTRVEGNISAENDIRIDGSIKGSLTCKSKVIIGPTGHVEGDVECANAVVEGRFDGNLVVRGLLDVRETAKISGDVSTGKLNIQAGAAFNVNCDMAPGKGKNDRPINTKSNNSVKTNKAIGEKVLNQS